MTGDPDAFKAFEAEGWSAQAGSYDRLTGRVTDRVAERLLDLAEVSPGDRVLDVATGAGAVAAAAVARGADVTGVDISQEMVEVARERVPGASFAVADAERTSTSARPSTRSSPALSSTTSPTPSPPSRPGRTLAPGGRLALSLWDRPERNRFLA